MSFRDVRKFGGRLSGAEIRLLFLAALGLALLLVSNIALARTLPGGEWLYLRWSGARAFLFEKAEPYSAVIAEKTQLVAYGRNAFSSEYGYALNDPFYIVLLYVPLALFSDFAFARGVWMLLSEAALIASVFFSIRLSEWDPPRGMLIALIVFVLFGYYSLLALISASVSIFLLFIYLSILLAIRSLNDELAGGLLLLAAYQWEAGALFFLFIVTAAVVNKRWRILSGFGMAALVALSVSFLTYPGWGIPYLRAVLSDWYRGAGLTLGAYLSQWFFNARFLATSALALALSVIVLLEWLGAFRSNFRRITWAASLSLAVAPLLGFAIFDSNHVVLTLPLILTLSLAWERWRQGRVLTSALALGLMFVAPYIFYAFCVATSQRVYFDLLALFPPIIAIAALYWMRWLTVRASQPWFEKARSR